MVLLYTTLGAITTLLSSIATAIIIVKLLRHWDLQVSSVRWLFFMFFVFLCIWTTARCTLFVWMLFVGEGRRVDRTTEKVLTTTKELDSVGIHSVPISNLAHSRVLAAIVVVGDVALFALTLWMFALTYELAKIARRSMDRGPTLEAKRIRLYKWSINGCFLAFACVEAGMAIRDGGYSIHVHRCLLVNYATQTLSLTFMISTIVYLKLRGLKYEAMHGTFVLSPVYQRLRHIMVVYAVCIMPYQITSVILFTTGERRQHMLSVVGISMVIYNCTGLALGVTTGCSQACVFQTFSACMPEDMEAQFTQRKFGVGGAADATFVEPPQTNPVFVFTDIEASSALWSLADDGVMDKATDLHDNILRSSLPRHHGYEITTCGDSFQLAFPTIRDAVSYCVDVQLQLLVAPWPKALHGLVPATKRQRSGHRLIFSGLRVRMGVHDAVADDGALVCARHAVTGKMTYTGASEAIASEVGDLGGGGQILVTQRVAAWAQTHRDELDVDVSVEYVGHFPMAAVECDCDVFQLLPSILGARRKHWRRASARLPATAPSTVPLSPLSDVVETLPGPPSAAGVAQSAQLNTADLSGVRTGRMPLVFALETIYAVTTPRCGGGYIALETTK